MQLTTDERRSNRVSRSNTDAAVYAFLSALGSPRSLTVWLLYDAGEHDQLLQLECDPNLYLDPCRFRDDYAATSLLSKSKFLSPTTDRVAVALEKFSKSEDSCRRVNDRLWTYSTDCFLPEASAELHPLVPRVRRKIKSILGRFDPEEMCDSSDWGPGVSTLLKGPTSVKPNKYQQETGMTQEVFDVVWPLLKLAYPSWWNRVLSLRTPTIEKGNVVITVPKNSKTDRVIAVEPGFNLWFQKGIGSMIRKRLLRRGCNLNDQSINQKLSSLAYRDGLATIDFSSASDTIAYEVVRLLLPTEWFRALRLFRCKFGQLPDGTLVRWNKFSSMGNGYTFELESLIFYAIALCVTEDIAPESIDSVSVFGDDVILPAACYPKFLELVELLGFSINTRKSFSGGNFFESCGAHWFQGTDVKPFYQVDLLVDGLDYWSMHNRIIEYAHRCADLNGLDDRFRRASHLVRTFSSPSDFHLVPLNYGDVGFYSNVDRALTLKTTRVQRMMGYRIRISSERPISLPFDGEGLIYDSLRSASGSQWKSPKTPPFEKERGNKVPLKSSTVRRVLFTIVPFGRWYNLGGWVSCLPPSTSLS